MKKVLVISAINLTEGGTLTILRDAVASATLTLGSSWDVTVLVHRKELLDNADLTIRIIELPRCKKSWGLRLYYEWHYFKQLSRELQADLWLSLHDMTPLVSARRQAVYCHNPAPFYKVSAKEAWLEPVFFLHNKFYRYLYQAFIRRNRFVIVQQDWLRDEFKRLFGSSLDVIVAHPQVRPLNLAAQVEKQSSKFVFLYPALSRVFKNFEVIGKAVLVLKQRGIKNFEVRLTLRGEENSYARLLYRDFGPMPELKFIGRQNSYEMAAQYRECSAVLFPSKLETWGLPISEAKAYEKPLLVADLPYAHETVGSYEQLTFFKPTDEYELADLMEAMIKRRWSGTPAVRAKPAAPFTETWPELWSVLTKGL